MHKIQLKQKKKKIKEGNSWDCYRMKIGVYLT